MKMIEGIGRRTRSKFQRAGREEQEANRFLSALDIPADLVYVTQQAGIGFHEHVLPLRLAFGGDTIAGFLRAADEIDTWLAGILDEL